MKKNFLFLLLIVGLVLTTMFNVVERIGIEKDAKNIEITLAYNDFKELADQSEYDVSWWFNKLSELGVYSVSLEEESINSLIQEGYELEVEVLHNLKKDTLWEVRYPNSFVEYVNSNDIDFSDVVLVSEDLKVKSFILDGLSLRYPEDFYTVFEDENTDSYAILFDGINNELLYTTYYKEYDESGKALNQRKDVVASTIYYMGLGFDEEKINNIKNGNLDVNLRPLNNTRFTENLADAYMQEFIKNDITPRVIIFTGKEVLGYPDNHIKTYDLMKEYDIVPALIETGVQRSNIAQTGLDEMVEYFDYQAVRVLPIIGWIQERFQHYNYDGGQEIENVIFRAATERNVRMVYFRPFMFNDEKYVVDPDEYEKSFNRLKERLEDHNMEFGEFSLMKFHDDSLLASIVTGVGLIAIVILGIRFFIKLPPMVEYILLILGAICLTGALYVAPNLGRQLLALTGAVVISSLGSIFLIEFAKDKYINKYVFRTREILVKSIFFTLALSLLALFGGLIVGGLLSHSKYLLEMEFFRGVKISELLPLAVFIGLYIIKFGYNRSREEIKENEVLPKDLIRFLKIDIKLIYIIFAGIIGSVLYIYIARSGHETTVQPSNLEMLFRNFLELKLLARPRLKEFLIAVPSMMLFIYIAYKAYKPLICLVGIPAVITFTSIINTFCHLRTPIYLSIIRSLLSIGFGIIIGTILILICEMLERIYHKFISKKNTFETEKFDGLVE